MNFRDFAPWNWPNPTNNEGRPDENSLRVLQSDIRRAVEAFQQAFPTRLQARWDLSSGGIEIPRIDVVETDSEVIVFVEMPGVQEEAIEVSLGEDILAIEGKKRAVELNEHHAFFMSERTFGTYQRVVPLPMRIDRDSVQASYLDGVVRITVSKAKVDEPAEKQIEVDKA